MLTSEKRKKVLIVDDESTVRESLRLILGRSYQVEVAESGNQALELLGKVQSAVEGGPDLILLDVMMPGMDGIGTLKEIRSQYPRVPVIMLTASTAVQTAVQAMKFGAVDYLNKPYDVDQLLSLVQDTIEQVDVARPAGRGMSRGEEEEAAGSFAESQVEGDFGAIVGEHPLICEIYKKIEQVAVRDTTILITGESGSGKELVAREIHARSNRAQGPFVALNCAAIPETLIESELFGHEKGAFTHAVERRLGHFELADKGTLFLDEIGELSPAVQVKILRFLQEQEFYRIGRSKPVKVDVRIVAATNRSLETAIREGRFRQDLYYRINVVNLELPPLRERREDIPALVQYFLKRLSAYYGAKDVTLSKEAVELLRQYSWPGNVRELENVIESILALSTGSEIGVSDLPSRLKTVGAMERSSPEGDGSLPFEEAERAFETDIILKALRRANYVQTKAAEILGISRRILKYKMDKLGIADDPQ